MLCIYHFLSSSYISFDIYAMHLAHFVWRQSITVALKSHAHRTSGVVTFDAHVDEATTSVHERFWQHVRNLPVLKPSPGPSFLGSFLTPHRDGINNVENLWKEGTNPRSSWTSAPAAESDGAAAVSVSLPAVVIPQPAKSQPYMSVYFGPWHPHYCDPVNAFIA
jgi:hypothetical protein